jgi:hypothetical protein
MPIYKKKKVFFCDPTPCLDLTADSPRLSDALHLLPREASEALFHQAQLWKRGITGQAARGPIAINTVRKGN